MANSYKILAQSKPGAATLTDAYTVPAATQTIVSTLTICNQSATPTSFRISTAVAGLADTPKQYSFYDVPIAGNESQQYTLGISLAATDVLRVYTTLATCSFVLWGVEIT
jgi:hypothetical protein